MSTTTTHETDLARALMEIERSMRDAIDVINRRIPDWDDEANGCVETLRLASEMVGCLRRMLPEATVATIHRAFGAPGDFGYDTPVGDALARLYGVR